MVIRRWCPTRLVAVAFVLLAMSWLPARAGGGTQNFFQRTASQLSRNAAVLAGIATEMGSRTDALADCSVERMVAEFASDELNDAGFMLMLGGELLDGSQMIEVGRRKDYYRHLGKVLEKTALQLSTKLDYLAVLEQKIVDPRTADDLHRAIGAIENSMKLLNQSVKNLDAQA